MGLTSSSHHRQREYHTEGYRANEQRVLSPKGLKAVSMGSRPKILGNAIAMNMQFKQRS